LGMTGDRALGTFGPVDEVHVELVDAEPSEALPGRGNRVVAPPQIEHAPRKELGGKEYLAAWHAAVAQRPSDALLVAIGLGRVNMAIPQVNRPPLMPVKWKSSLA
jgi:hypothetical protein